MEPFQNNPDFTPEQIEKASKACTAICMWANAMYQYHFVALGVAPKVSPAVTNVNRSEKNKEFIAFTCS